MKTLVKLFILALFFSSCAMNSQSKKKEPQKKEKKSKAIHLTQNFFPSINHSELSDAEIKAKADSILKEGNLLYKYEKAAWISTDDALQQPEIRDNFGGYFVYQNSDTVKTVILSREQKCVAEYSFLEDFQEPEKSLFSLRSLTEKEKRLINIRGEIISQIIENKYELGYPEGFNLNMILIPADKGYKLYFVTGTPQSGILPFGNDFLFTSDNEGKITGMRKFHTSLIPLSAKAPNGESVTGLMHSHIQSVPFISATDICTFKLYGPMYGIQEFSVLSTALSKIFTYNHMNNSISIKNK